MEETLVQVKGVLVTDPFAYQSVEEADEVMLAKFEAEGPLEAAVEIGELYLHLGKDARGLKAGDRVEVSGLLVERQMVTRSGKIRRGGAHQILVKEIKW